MIPVTDNVQIDENDLEYNFARGSGPGGQNVDKVASAVELRYNVRCADLPARVRERLEQVAGNRITTDGVLIVRAHQHRSQERNRQAALDRLVQIVRRAAKKPKRRKKTKIPRAAKEKRLENKRRRSQKKKWRKKVKRKDW